MCQIKISNTQKSNAHVPSDDSDDDPNLYKFKGYISFAECNTEQSPVDMTHENSESF